MKRSLYLFLCVCCCAAPSVAQQGVLSRAQQLFATGAYEQAAHLLEGELEKHPDLAEDHLLLAQVYTLEDRRSDAIHEFTRTIELSPNSAAAYNKLGAALNRFAEFEQARKAFEQSIALDPKIAETHLNLAMSLAQAGEMPAAVEHLKAAIQLAPHTQTEATAHYFQAKIYSDHEPDQALAELNAAVKVDPHNLEAWIALGQSRRSNEDEPGALAAFSHAVAIAPGDAEAQYELGSEYLAQDKAALAVEHLKLARKLMPHPSVALLYKLDRALRAKGAAEEAAQVRSEAKAMLAQDTHANQQFVDAQLRENEALELEKQGQYEKALDRYRAALELDPNQQGFRLNYALDLCRLNRWKEGIGELKDIIATHPDNIEARRALFIAEDKARQAASQPAKTDK